MVFIFFGILSMIIFIGVVNLMYDSFMLFVGGMVLINMMFGEVVLGGVGVGMYGILVFVVIVVFLVGLMVGCILEYFGKKLGVCEIKFVSFYILMILMFVLVGIVFSFVIFGVW